MTRPRIGFVGLTHLGLVSAAAAAQNGYSVVGIDADAATVERLRSGSLPLSEPGLAEAMTKNRHRIDFTAEWASLDRCDLVYVAPDVATDDVGRSDLAAVDRLLERSLACARRDAVVILLSQVPPGYTRAHAPGGRTVFYQVETLIFGKAVERALHPERIIVGAPHSDARLPAPYRAYLDSFECPCLVMRYESAELAKIAINCFLAASVSTTNALAELCEKIGADWSEIAPALRLDQRIGPHAYLSPGLGIAGGNLERDLASVRRMAETHGADPAVVESWIASSARRKDWVYERLREKLLAADPRARVAILGLAYKPDTDSTKNAPSLALIARLSQARLSVYDPVVRNAAPEAAAVAADWLSAVQGADAVAIMTAWEEFRAIDPRVLAEAMSGRLVIDPYRTLDRTAAAAAGLDYIALGISEPGS